LSRSIREPQTGLGDGGVPELAVRAKGGSAAAMTELVERFEGRLFNFLLRRAGTTTEAEELTQETFVRAWMNIGRYDPRWQFSTWLFTIAGRLAIGERRKRRPVTLGVVGVPDVEAPDDGGERRAAREQGASLWALADRVLSGPQRAALWLRYAEDLAPTEIGRVLGKRVVTVRVMLMRARRALAAHATRPPVREPVERPVMKRAAPPLTPALRGGLR
jgi:RNA polymerase sigma-70 factor (ECF subfamily)